MKYLKAIVKNGPLFILTALFLASVSSCSVIHSGANGRHDNGLHRGSYKNKVNHKTHNSHKVKGWKH